MLLTPRRVRRVRGLTAEQEALARAWLQGAVYAWCAGHPEGQWFDARDLVGGLNRDWQGTPLWPIFMKHHPAPAAEKRAEKRAGEDLGRLLLGVCDKDRRWFGTQRAKRITQYRWVRSPAAGSAAA